MACFAQLACVRECGLSDPHIDRLLDRLTIEFQASVARAEGEAAADLALSLAQSISFQEQLSRRPCFALLENRPPLEVVAVATDYLLTAEPVHLIPLDRAILRRPSHSDRTPISTVSRARPHEAPRTVDGTLVEFLRAHSREMELRVTIAWREGEISGQLRLVGPDHLVISAARDEILVPRQAVEWVRLDQDARGPR